MRLDDASGCFSWSDVSVSCKNVIIFSTDMSSSVHACNRKKDILIVGKGQMHGLDNITLTAEKEFSINFTEQQKIVFFKKITL